MNQCKRVKRLLSRYLDQEADDKEVIFVKGHLAGCPFCSEEYSGLLRIKRLFAAKERKALPADYLVSRLRDRIAASRQEEERSALVSGMARLSLRLIPVPVTVIAISLLFMALTLQQRASEFSIEEHILSGDPTTIETAARVILQRTN